MPGDTPMPFMSVKGDPATWARVGDTIRVVRLKPYGREFDYVVESVDPSGFAINRTDCRGKGNGEFYGEYPGDYAVVSRAAPKPDAPAPAPLAFDAALAALDVEVNINAHRQVTTYDILGLDAVRAAHRAEVERAVAEERDRNLDVLADFYSKTRAGRYASLSKEARQARLDVLTHAYSRMGGGLIHERADELDRDEPIDGEAIRARGTKS